MAHGILCGTVRQQSATPDDKDFADEVHEIFRHRHAIAGDVSDGPHCWTGRNWDDLAEAAKWSQANADVLVDTHWVGGDPGKGEIYGWASWCKRKGILVLRNPDDQPASITLDLGEVFELPEGAATVPHEKPVATGRREARLPLARRRPAHLRASAVQGAGVGGNAQPLALPSCPAA